MGTNHRCEGLGLSFRFAIVGDGVERFGVAHAMALEEDNHPLGGSLALKTNLDGTIGQMPRRFKAGAFEGEGVVSPDMAIFLHKEEFVVDLIRGQELDLRPIQSKAVQRRHLQGAVCLDIVVFLDPMNELLVKRLKRTQVQLADQELVAHGAKEALDLALGSPVPNGSVMEQTAQSGTDLNDFFGSIDGAIVDIERSRDAPFVEGGLERGDQGIDVLGEEKLSVSAETTGIINESDEP